MPIAEHTTLVYVAEVTSTSFLGRVRGVFSILFRLGTAYIIMVVASLVLLSVMKNPSPDFYSLAVFEIIKLAVSLLIVWGIRTGLTYMHLKSNRTRVIDGTFITRVSMVLILISAMNVFTDLSDILAR